jgi:oxygen-independent coproporphyrinogen-3 oxidase
MDTIRKVIELAPDRITLIRYAHIPESRAHQRALNKYAMPDDADKTAMFFDAAQAFKDAGWEHIGIDHFALPNDSLASAFKNRILTRSFGGYNASDINTMIGIGPTATMRIGNLYAQNTYSLEEYKECVNSGVFPVKRGYRLDADDIVRREIIDSILCRYELDFGSVEKKHCLMFSEYFASELRKLHAMAEEGLIELSQKCLRITSDGRFFLRHVCKVFDKFLQDGKHYVVNGP